MLAASALARDKGSGNSNGIANGEEIREKLLPKDGEELHSCLGPMASVRHII
jgi:hypothetical protein